jgi:hypothetical protein
VVAAVGLVASVVGAVLDPRRAAASYLAAFAAVLGVALGALALVMIAHVTGATWFVLLRRRAEDVLATLPALAVLFVPLLLAVRVLYPWAGPLGALAPGLRAAVDAKRAYLNVPFFAVRAVLYWGTWIALAELLRGASLRQDRAGDAGDAAAARALDRRMRALSAAGLPALALTLTFASFDWMMSLSPAWSSTVYGVYAFAGGAVGALALLAVLAARRPRGDATNPVGDEHRHALGKLLLTFVLFWAYLGYAQYVVVWSADLPAEVGWYVARVRGGWGAVAAVLVAGHLVLPALALLVRAVKRSRVALAAVGAWLLAMHYLDVYWLLLPERTPGRLAPHWLDVAALAAVVGVAVAAGVWRRGTEPALPAGDPRLAAALAYRGEGG